MKYLFVTSFLGLMQPVFAQPATEVYLFDIKTDGSLAQPINVSDNPGYDNQPSFTRGGSHLLYASTRGDQTDIIKYDIETGEKSWMTATKGGEFSPTQIPGSYEFSSILLEPDGRQLLWRYSLNGGAGEILIPYLKIGYHTWVTDDLLYAFVLGPHPTLQRIEVTSQRAEILGEDIGRSLHFASDIQKLIFVDKEASPWMVSILDPVENSVSLLAATLPESEDMALSSDGYLWMGKGRELYKMKVEPEADWELVDDISRFGLGGITRLAIHPDNQKIALVATE